MVEVRDVAPGLWLWRQPHPDWDESAGWEPPVSSFFVESRGERAVLDPLAPPPSAREVWDRIEAAPPTMAIVLKPDHVRDVDLFVRWYGARAYGPRLFFRDNVPESELEWFEHGQELPGGFLALTDNRNRLETPLYLPEQRALVFADGMTAQDGPLRIWDTDHLEKRVLPELRAMLELPFEHVLVSHGDPVHTRDDFIAALEREPYRGES
jgi:glyoxylase-like metal-dependent hydrolase (beta-lactamase superfamily II)